MARRIRLAALLALAVAIPACEEGDKISDPTVPGQSGVFTYAVR